MVVTPAEVLAAAADKLEALASKVPAGPWGAEERSVEALGGESAWQRDVVFVGGDGEGGASTPRVAEYIAAMNPLVGKALAEVLRREANALKRSAQTPGFDGVTLMLPDDVLLALARLIIGGES